MVGLLVLIIASVVVVALYRGHRRDRELNKALEQQRDVRNQKVIQEVMDETSRLSKSLTKGETNDKAE